MKARIVSKKTLLTVSGIADALDFTGMGLFPGPWSLIIDVPVTILHFLYAGPRAFMVLAEYVPGVGVLPMYTLAALTYPDAEKVDKGSGDKGRGDSMIIDVTPVPPRHDSVTLR